MSNILDSVLIKAFTVYFLMNVKSMEQFFFSFELETFIADLFLLLFSSHQHCLNVMIAT